MPIYADGPAWNYLVIALFYMIDAFVWSGCGISNCVGPKYNHKYPLVTIIRLLWNYLHNPYTTCIWYIVIVQSVCIFIQCQIMIQGNCSILSIGLTFVARYGCSHFVSILMVIMMTQSTPDIKVHGTNMGPTWVLSAPNGPHVDPMNLAIRDSIRMLIGILKKCKISKLGALDMHIPWM